eukprot:gb/GECG01009111.1/.p1 GENE.gb/GECG01009111.1/~~gb/GECG01009111.1/.p1  ORF type:complete len:176 (+),score=4.65 gb/GECG01009111.1/:1-528(+)
MTSKGMPPRVIAEHEVSKNVQGGEGADYIRDVFTNNPLISQRFELHDGKEKGLPPFIDMVASSIVAETGVNALVLLRLRNKARYSSYLVEAAAVDACFPDVLNCRFVRQRTAHVTVIRTLWIPVRTFSVAFFDIRHFPNINICNLFTICVFFLCSCISVNLMMCLIWHHMFAILL